MTMASRGRRRPEINVVTQYLRELRHEARAARRLDAPRPPAAHAQPRRAVRADGHKAPRPA
jgi:hypothetical protein